MSPGPWEMLRRDRPCGTICQLPQQVLSALGCVLLRLPPNAENDRPLRATAPVLAHLWHWSYTRPTTMTGRAGRGQTVQETAKDLAIGLLAGAGAGPTPPLLASLARPPGVAFCEGAARVRRGRELGSTWVRTAAKLLNLEKSDEPALRAKYRTARRRTELCCAPRGRRR